MSETTERRRSDITRLAPWFHNLHLPGGLQTAPDHFLGDFPRYKWERLGPYLPERLDGWTALDIGCNAGYYSFELARRGASVLGIDLDAHYLRQAAWAASELGLERQVEFRRMQVYELPRLGQQFDLVLFLGVFYHLRYPLLGLDLVARCTRRLLAFQTLTLPGMEIHPDTSDRPIDAREELLLPGWPKMAFIEHRFAGDPTNWWVPNHAGVEAMLRSAGVPARRCLGHEMYLCEPAPSDPAGEPPYDFTSELMAATGRAWR